MNEQENWFAAQLPGIEDPNPCVRIYGLREGKHCKECRLFRRKNFNRKTYFKCALRGDTRGRGTDHRANWNACVKFVPLPQKDTDEKIKAKLPGKGQTISISTP